MERYTKLGENFYALNLYYGKTNLTSSCSFQSFFLVEHPCSEDYIREQALTVWMSQCKNVQFYGSYSRQWKSGFDLVKIQLHPNYDEAELVETSQWNHMDAFVEAIQTAVLTRCFVPGDIYLIYDDERILREVLGKLRLACEKAVLL